MLPVVGWTGFDFVRSWLQHSSRVLSDGVFFALAVILMVIGLFELKVGGWPRSR